jgi:glycine cleavage system H lipoate-binding protein
MPTWVWLADNSVINGANSGTYTVTVADIGKTLKARVSYANQSGYVESSVTAAVVPAALTGTVTLNNTSPVVGNTVTATYNPGNGSGTPTWVWLADNNVINGANSNTYTVAVADIGKTLKARVSYANQSGNVESSVTAAVVPAVLTGTVTINNTSPVVGNTVTAAYNPGNGSGTQTWVWLADNSVISGANSNTYTVAVAHVGKTLRARVSYANQSGSVTSNPTASVAKEESFSITFTQITDTAPSITGPTIYRSSDNGPTTVPLTVDNPSQYSSITWYITGTVVITGTGASFTLNSASSSYNSIGEHFLTLEVWKDGKPYNKTVTFTVKP